MAVDRRAAAAFGAMAEQYERGRPGWPAAAVAGVVERFGARTVLDLAAGTGKLTSVLASAAPDVMAVEPVEGMRRVLSRLPGVRVLDGTAEAIPLPDASVDAVFVAEAFHWFDLARAPAEIARVLRPGGGLAVMWNMADEHEPWFDELVALIIQHRLPEAGKTGRDSVPWREALEAEPRLGPLQDEAVVHRQETDRDRIVDQIASFSSIGALPDDKREAALSAVRALLERHGVDEVTLTYRAEITTARRLDG
jgi:ubiquinone/menaquinone biosynthesis C-methylase UbiE